MNENATGTRPLVLVRGFGGPDVSGDQGSPYQGFNDGTVYPGKRGENYIYEGLLLRALKSTLYPYRDATNVIGYYAKEQPPPDTALGFPATAISGSVVLDPAIAKRILQQQISGTIWVFRYYDLTPRELRRYGAGLVRLIDLLEQSASQFNTDFNGVDIIAHSMGGLVVREALKQLHAREENSAGQKVHRIVTLGTPHRGIAFQRLPDWLLKALPGVEEAADELASFDPRSTEFLKVDTWFPVRRILTVVGTNYRTYGTRAASMANRMASLFDEGSLALNRSDGLVKQASAQLPGAPRTFVDKCHGGSDSLVTSREAYEIAMRFFHGTHTVRLWLDEARVKRGGDFFGKSEFYFGASIKARGVDFELFHQSVDAENCYGPFNKEDLSDGPPPLAGELSKSLSEAGDDTTGWAGDDRLIWEGWIDGAAKQDDDLPGLVFRLDLYVGERDRYGIGFSDNVIFRKQYYVQAFPGEPVAMFVHTSERYLGTTNHPSREELSKLATAGAVSGVHELAETARGGEFTLQVGGTGFEATLRVRVAPDSE
jgi:pimeloyl-ACP methyl ester carboxylesterase